MSIKFIQEYTFEPLGDPLVKTNRIKDYLVSQEKNILENVPWQSDYNTGVDNTDVDSSKLYTQPEEVGYAYGELMKISDQFTVAAAFGNVHGVYKPGNVKLTPVILDNSQKYVHE